MYAKPYKWQVWLTIVISIPFGGFLLWSFYKVTRKLHRTSEKDALSLPGAIWMTYGSPFQNARFSGSISTAISFMAAFWWFYVIVIDATYSANLIAFLAVDTQRPPFETLSELADNNEYLIGVVGGTAWMDEMRLSNLPSYQKLWAHISEKASDGHPVLHHLEETHIRLLYEGNYAYITDLMTYEVASSTTCDIAAVKEKYITLNYGIGLQKNSAYTNMISLFCMDIRSQGLISKWKSMHWPKQLPCRTPRQAVAVTLKDFQIIIISFFVMLFVSFVTLLLENKLFVRQRHKTKQNK